VNYLNYLYLGGKNEMPKMQLRMESKRKKNVCVLPKLFETNQKKCYFKLKRNVTLSSKEMLL